MASSDDNIVSVLVLCDLHYNQFFYFFLKKEFNLFFLSIFKFFICDMSWQ